jgi:hypothetical protein
VQVGILCFRLFQARQVRVGVVPQGKKVLISRTSFGKGLRQGSAFRVVAGHVCAWTGAGLRFARDFDARLEGIGPAQAKAGQRTYGKGTDEAGMVNYLLKLRRRRFRTARNSAADW